MYGYIYEIKNDLNNRTYIGQHKCSEVNDYYMGSGKILKQAYNKYGIEHFTKRILQYCVDKKDLDFSEKLWIAEYKSLGKAEYNIAKGGDGGDTFSGLSAEKKAKRRKQMSDYWISNNPMYNPEHKQKCIDKRRELRNSGWVNPAKGKPHTEEHNNKVKEGLNRYFETHHGANYGVPKSDSWKQKASNSHKGLHWYNNGKDCVQAKECPEGFVPGMTDEMKKHHSKPLSEEQKAKLRGKPAWNKGKKFPNVHPIGSKGKHWYTNGKQSVMSVTCPEGFVPGRTLQEEANCGNEL